ncbi:hypothetical protein MF271_20130 (plasmid) [Deinococcus sp. KNUC1210]|uniref:hypothetical protein n=1 Tax=Deinococcus sp. KNUC1210 TaxID=2917691 RepID=UPI001EF09FA2|nr:hypothetical protein [Deinococcus sp. KNUC1210]ULH17719.1 hypothetical protein MF271_20130 [Deinococcus sp. KNUC1210]
MTSRKAGSTGSRDGGVAPIDQRDSERVLNEANSRHRVSWPGIFVGLITGITLLAVLGMLGVAIGASTASTLSGLGIGALIWTALTVLISAYMAGYTAVRAGNQALATRGQFTGLVTGMLLTLALTLFLSNLVSGLANTASNVIGSVASGAANVTAAAGNAAANNSSTQDAASSLLSGLNADSIGQIIGDASPGLSDAQSTAAAKVVSGIITRASNDLGSNLGNITKLSDIVTNRVDNIQKALTGPEFVTRLTRQGLTQQQAQATQTAIVAQAKKIQQQASDAAEAAARIARQAAITTSWLSLLVAGLVILFSTLGGNQAASTREKIGSAAQNS